MNPCSTALSSLARWNSETPDSRSSQRWLVAKVMATWTRLIPGRMRQFPAWHDALQRQKGCCNDHHGERGKGEVELGLDQMRCDSITVIPRTAGWRLP